PSVRNDVLPGLSKAGCNSGPCHGALAGKNGFRLSLRGYDPVTDYFSLTREALGRRLVKMAPARSLILLKPTLTLPHGGGKRFEVDSPEYRVIADWIAAGAPAPKPGDPVIENIEVDPEKIVLHTPGDTVRISVRARFSDGSVRDVTRQTKFSSTNEGVVEVGDRGLVTAKGHGEGAVSVWYSSKVAFSRVSVPHERQLGPEVFGQAPRNNWVDDLVLAKLSELRIPPSPLCDDNTFIRRVYLDTLGVLPGRQDLSRFLGDTRADRRARLIDSVLDRPEYVDYWAYKWSDLLLVSSRKLEKAAMWSYYAWIRNGVAENRPWDRFIEELVTATGSNLENGAVNYWLIHQQPQEITENLSQAFLGISLTCARCHNHPLEKWTQDQYYGMANLVSRVRLKNGQAAGEVTLVPRPVGEVSHPRLGRPMPPQPLDGEALELDDPADRRRHLARWLVGSEHFARSLVNRVWAHFFGRGVVDPEDDLRATNPASNEALLSALTRDFMDNGHDVKRLIRTILNSATYQLSSTGVPANRDDEEYFSHHRSRRLPAEVVLDAMSQVTGVPEEFKGYPLGTRALQLPETQVESYFLDSFGRPPRLTSGADERKGDANVAQVLHLINGGTLNRKLRAEGGAVDRLLELELPAPELVERVYESALSRRPSRPEVARLVSALDLEQASRAGVGDLFW
ncbi:MAG: DUF1549 domain-containing protein, partial [Candidatus Aminicenantes bacterium]|nr:DUF1549 domain-containing protein [Candidatus Aminicenantes bacterium]